MQAPTLNGISQTQHLPSKSVDHYSHPDPFVYAPEDGVVESYGQRGTPGTTDDAGNALRLTGPTGLHQFAHLESAYVSPGQRVKRGQKIAKMGYTGYTQPDNVPAGAHLHYWVQTPNGYVYPPTLYKDQFISEGEEVNKFTKAQVDRLIQIAANHPAQEDQKSVYASVSADEALDRVFNSDENKIMRTKAANFDSVQNALNEAYRKLASVSSTDDVKAVVAEVQAVIDKYK